jgi:hypothetical protein
MDAARLRQQLAQDLRDHLDLGRSLIAIRGPLVKGWLHERCSCCRKEQCRCPARDDRPFLYASVRLRHRVTQLYVGKPEDSVLVHKIQAYGEFREKLSRLRVLQRRIEAGWKALQRSLLSDPRK